MGKSAVIAIFLLISISACKKKNSPEINISTYKQILSSGSVKTWTLNKLFINGTESTLTPGQARFTKTYKADNTWIDSDGQSGTYVIESIQKITEKTLNPPQTENIEYKILIIENTKLELEYSVAGVIYRLVFTL